MTWTLLLIIASLVIGLTVLMVYIGRFTCEPYDRVDSELRAVADDQVNIWKHRRVEMPDEIPDPFHAYRFRDGRVYANDVEERGPPLAEYLRCIARGHPDWNGVIFATVDDVATDTVKPFPVCHSNIKRAQYGKGVLMLPDLYFTWFSSGIYDFVDPVAWDAKDDTVTFRGAATGDLDASNKRVRLWRAVQGLRGMDYKFTGVPICEDHHLPASAFCDDETITKQCRSKYLITVDGNGAAWNRVVWQLRSNSVMLMWSDTDMFWTRGLVDMKHYVAVTPENIGEKIEWLRQNDNEARKIAERGTTYAKTYVDKERGIRYTEYMIKKLWDVCPDLTSASTLAWSDGWTKITCIILTCTVTPSEIVAELKQTDPGIRLAIYEKTIKAWLEKSEFPVIVIENSGHDFSYMGSRQYNHRFECFTISPTEQRQGVSRLVGKDAVSKGQHELYSIQYALQRSELAIRHRYVLKVGGRYFCPGLEEALGGVTTKTKVIRQSKRGKCEVLGGTYWDAKRLFKFPASDQHVEHHYDAAIDKYKSEEVYILPVLKVEPVRTGGADSLVTEI